MGSLNVKFIGEMQIKKHGNKKAAVQELTIHIFKIQGKFMNIPKTIFYLKLKKSKTTKQLNRKL